MKAAAGEKVINQGDAGDFLFVIEKGTLECFKKFPDGDEKMVGVVRDRAGEDSRVLQEVPRWR